LIRAAAWFFLSMTALYAVILGVSLASGPSAASIDCDRARGTCEVRLPGTTHSAAITDIAKAELVHERPQRNASASDTGRLILSGGKELWLGEPAYHDDTRAAYRAAVNGVNGFLADPAAPRFTGTYTSRDTDWLMLVMFMLMLPLFAWTFTRMAIASKVAVDRGARTIQHDAKPMLRRARVRSVPFSEATAVAAVGSASWCSVFIRAGSGDVFVVRLPRTRTGQALLTQTLGALSKALGVQVEASEGLRKQWGL
jgi:hypothetical protein